MTNNAPRTRCRLHLPTGLLLCAVLTVSTSGCGTEPPTNNAADATAADGGSTDGGATEAAALFLNEVVAKGVTRPGFNDTGSDWIELYNSGSAEIDLQGYRLIDSAKKTFDAAYALPPGTTILGGGYLVVFFNSEGNGTPVIQKKLGADEAASLFHPSGLLVDRVNWETGDSPAAASWGRSPDGGKLFKTFAKPTPNAAND